MEKFCPNSFNENIYFSCYDAVRITVTFIGFNSFNIVVMMAMERGK